MQITSVSNTFTGFSSFAFNGKENDNEITGVTGTDLDFGARMYDTRVGIFFSIDLLSAKFSMFSPYIFAADNPIRYIDVSGLGPGDLYSSVDAAAINFGQTYNDNSIVQKVEYAATIYEVVKTNPKTMEHTVYYAYSVPASGTFDRSWNTPSPAGSVDVALVHTHGEETQGWLLADCNSFSTSDKDLAKYWNLNNYVATPNGSLQKYDVATGGTTTISTEMPSDFKCGSDGLNKNYPQNYSQNEPSISTTSNIGWFFDHLPKALTEVFNIFEYKESSSNNSNNANEYNAPYKSDNPYVSNNSNSNVDLQNSSNSSSDFTDKAPGE